MAVVFTFLGCSVQKNEENNVPLTSSSSLFLSSLRWHRWKLPLYLQGKLDLHIMIFVSLPSVDVKARKLLKKTREKRKTQERGKETNGKNIIWEEYEDTREKRKTQERGVGEETNGENIKWEEYEDTRIGRFTMFPRSPTGNVASREARTRFHLP